jgi:hypothetical protein
VPRVGVAWQESCDQQVTAEHVAPTAKRHFCL